MALPHMLLLAAALAVAGVHAATPAVLPETAAFTEKHCATCHNDIDKEGDLDLTSLAFKPDDPANAQRWVLVHDRLLAGEMPPKNKKRPDPAEASAFLRDLSTALASHDRQTAERHGRSTQRRLNRYEFENALRDLLHAPWLQVKGDLPEDGEAELFNKVGDVLDVSHVQMTRYLRLTQQALRQVMAVELARQELPPTTTRRHYARDETVWTRTFLRRIDGNGNPERTAFPVLGFGPQPDVRALRTPLTVGDADPATRELEAVGWMRGNYHPFHTIWDNFRAPVAGRYRVRWSGYTIWVGPYGFNTATVREKDGTKKLINREPQWYLPNGDDVSPGRRDEAITVYAQGPTDVRRLGNFDLTPTPTVHDLGTVWLNANEALVTDAARFYRNRPGSVANPLAQRDGAPAVAFRWMEVEGPLWDDTATAGYRLLFGDLALEKTPSGGVLLPALQPSTERANQGAGGYGRVVRAREEPVRVRSADPRADAERLLRGFMARAYRRPVREDEVQRYLGVIHGELAAGHDFTHALLAGYSAVICSPGFLFVEERPGPLDDHALATRLAFFLTNSPPDATLRALADRRELRRPGVLRAETERLLDSPRSARFVEAFLDYWLELRKHDATTPSNTLYPDYYLDEQLVEASLDEARLFFSELLHRDLPARNLIHSDFTYLNERLAAHYGVPGISGGAMRRVTLPSDSVRGGVLTQAIVLKVTANGTTTSPVIRGKWIADRILGLHIPPPPSTAGAVDPDTRGAVTIRQQLDRHRADPKCASCHIKIDPAGFALENFDVMGGWRDRYRGDSKDKLPEIGIGKNGWPFDFHYALPVDATGQLPDGRPFRDIREFKRLLAEDTESIARNLTRHLVVFATAAPVRFGDRPHIERILSDTKSGGHGLRALVHAIVQSELFQTK